MFPFALPNSAAGCSHKQIPRPCAGHNEIDEAVLFLWYVKTALEPRALMIGMSVFCSEKLACCALAPTAGRVRTTAGRGRGRGRGV